MFQLGVLGSGYVAQRLMLDHRWADSSWSSQHDDSSTDRPNHLFPFEWNEPGSWGQLPEQASGLLLSIPPQSKTVEREAARLHRWGQWMQHNRPQLKYLVYLSSTSVLPNIAGCFNEQHQPHPSHLKGELRLITEQVLSHYFQLKIIRPAAIYGPSRGIATRVKHNQPIAAHSGPIYRIHVNDLTQICYLALCEPDFPSLVHAADPHPATSLEVAQWYIKQPGHQEQVLQLDKGYKSRKGVTTNPKRQIQCLALQQWGYHFLFPSYKEGMTHDESA